MRGRLLALAVVLTGAVSGCGVTRDGAIAPSVNDCVAALPVAQSLLGRGARLDLLRRYPLVETQQVLHRLGAPALVPADAATRETPPSGRPAGPRPCLLVFTGHFTLAGLQEGPGHPASDAVAGAASGGYALVVTTTRHPRVLRAVVAVRPPLG